MSPRLRRVVSGLLSLLSRCYPATFRDRYGDDLRLTYLDRLNAEHASGGTAGVLRYSLRMAGRVIWDGLSERVEDRRRRPRPSGRWRSDLLSIRRAIARRPGFYGAAVVTFGLGVGATASVFSVVDAVPSDRFPTPLHESSWSREWPSLNSKDGVAWRGALPMPFVAMVHGRPPRSAVTRRISLRMHRIRLPFASQPPGSPGTSSRSWGLGRPWDGRLRSPKTLLRLLGSPC